MFSADKPFTNEAWRLVKRHLGFAALFSALVNLLYLAPTIYMIQVYDRVVPTRGVVTLLFITAVVLFSLATLAILDQMRGAILHNASVALDETLGPRLVRMTLSNAARRPQQVMRDFDTVKMIAGSPALGALMDLPWAPIYVIVATIIHPLLGLTTVIGAVILLLLALANDRATRAASKAAADQSASIYFAQEALAGSLEAIRALGMRDALVNQFVASRRASAAPGRAAARTASRYSGTIKFARLSLQSIALGIGAYLAVEDMISAGAIISASVLMSRALAPVDQMVSGWRQIGEARNALASLNSFMLSQPEEREPTALPAPKPRLHVDGVVIAAPAQDSFILKGISFTVEGPAIVAVVGPSGAGKSTLLEVLANARKPDRGSVRIDHADMANWKPEALARHVGYLPQDNLLLSGSIKDNISRFRSCLGDEVDQAAVDAAIRAGAHEMILRLPGGYDMQLGARGRGLSAGQQQRVALARALYGGPVLVVLDEPYSALDHDSEEQLLTSLRALRDNGALVIVAAHKNNIVQLSDYLAVVHDGTLRSFGRTQDELARFRKPAEMAL